VNDSSIITDFTSSDYEIDSYLVYEDPDRYSEPALVPFFNGAPVYRYSFVEQVGYPDSYYGIHQLWPILSDQVGDSFDAYWVDQRYGTPVEVVRVKSKTFNGKDSVLLLESKWETWNYPVRLLCKSPVLTNASQERLNLVFGPSPFKIEKLHPLKRIFLIANP
jgi:hypothetical protein